MSGQESASLKPHPFVGDMAQSTLDGYQGGQRLRTAPCASMVEIGTMAAYCNPKHVNRVLSTGTEACPTMSVDGELLQSKLN